MRNLIIIIIIIIIIICDWAHWDVIIKEYMKIIKQRKICGWNIINIKYKVKTPPEHVVQILYTNNTEMTGDRNQIISGLILFVLKTK